MKIAVDFDGTVVHFAFPAIGKPMPGAFEVLKKLKKAGHVLILWTCREDRKGKPYLTQAVDFCKEHGIEFDSVNCNRPEDGYAEEFKEKQNRKIFADLYIDDKNLGGFPGWAAVEEAVLGGNEKRAAAERAFLDFLSRA